MISPRLQKLSKVLVRTGAFAIGSVTLAFGFLLSLNVFFGGLRVTTAGQAYGIRIGMTKPEVVQVVEYGPVMVDVQPSRTETFHGSTRHVTELKTDSALMAATCWYWRRNENPAWSQLIVFDQSNRVVRVETDVRFLGEL